MTSIYSKEVNKITECDLLHGIINPILEMVEQSLRTFEFYWTVDVIP